MRPDVGFSTPVMTLISVDLPAPLSPMRPTISFRPIDSVTLRRAWTAPKYFSTFSSRTMWRNDPDGRANSVLGCSKSPSPRPAGVLGRAAQPQKVLRKALNGQGNGPSPAAGPKLQFLPESRPLQRLRRQVQKRAHAGARRRRIAVAHRLEDCGVLVDRKGDSE